MAHSVLGEVECWCSSSSVRVARHTAQDARREASKLTRCKESKKKKKKRNAVHVGPCRRNAHERAARRVLRVKDPGGSQRGHRKKLGVGAAWSPCWSVFQSWAMPTTV